MPYAFVIVPLLVYVLLFLYETAASFRRLMRASKQQSEYLHATWEITHTILIIGVTNFVWLFSDLAKKVSNAVYWGLIFAGFFFIVRAILYIYLFYIKREAKDKKAGLADYLFAAAHLGVLAGLVYTMARAADVLINNPYTINRQFIPWMWPGLIVTLAVGALPLFHLYKTKN